MSLWLCFYIVFFFFLFFFFFLPCSHSNEFNLLLHCYPWIHTINAHLYDHKLRVFNLYWAFRTVWNHISFPFQLLFEFLECLYQNLDLYSIIHLVPSHATDSCLTEKAKIIRWNIQWLCISCFKHAYFGVHSSLLTRRRCPLSSSKVFQLHPRINFLLALWNPASLFLQRGKETSPQRSWNILILNLPFLQVLIPSFNSPQTFRTM